MKLLIVEWADSHSSEQWRWVDEIQGQCGPLHCRSVGWLARETKKHLLLIPHLSAIDDPGVRSQGRGEIVIPKAAIRKRHTIPIPKRLRIGKLG